MKASPSGPIGISIFFVALLCACKKDKHQPSDDVTVTTLVANLNGPHGIATDLQGNIYVTELSGYRVKKITPMGTVSTLAGNGRRGNIDGNDTSARFSEIYGIAVDAQGNVFVADRTNSSIRKITPIGIISTFAQIHSPSGVAIDRQQNVYVSSQYSHRIYKIDPTGLVSTFAGNGTAGFIDGNRTSAQFNGPRGIAIDVQGNIFVADEDNASIRKITPEGVVSTLASIGETGIFGWGADALAVDAEGNVFVVGGGYKIHKITSAGAVSIIAGSTRGYVDGNGSVAQFTGPAGIAVDAQKNIYITDYTLGHIRKIILK